ncbi:MAG: HAD family acid phosphatase [Bryobacteraceae bacterium]|nr:HAD family acid phosphatase [Bryobacteraceae bacterium]
MRIVLLLFATGALCAQTLKTHENLNATLWSQSAAEYRGATQTIFRGAKLALDLALRNKKWTAVSQTGKYQKLKPAIVSDIDETLLDNSPFQARMVDRGINWDPKSWTEWVNEGKAEPIPGALEFLRYAASRGVTVFYVTNRRHAEEEAATKKNLQKFDFPWRDDMDVLLTAGENGWTSDKQARREHVAKSFRVVMLMGDDFNDFVPAYVALEKRAELEKLGAANWGSTWFLIPNPTYGSWEAALYGFDRTLSREQVLGRKYESLRK